MNRTSLLALFVLCPLTAGAQQYPCATTLGTNCTAGIVDKSSVTSTLIVQPGACADDARVVDVDVRVKLVHTAVGDLTLSLVHPSGKRVDLLYRAGLAPDAGSCVYDDLDLTFSDEASANVTCNFTIPAVTGTVKPFNPLSALDGLERNGVWQLIIADAQGVSDGVLQSWQLDLPCTLPAKPGVTVATGVRDAVEGSTTPATVVFTRDGDLTAALTVGFTLAGTAVAGLDYQLPARTLDFAAGEATATLSFTALADGLAETTESAVVTVAPGDAWVVNEPSSAGVNFIDVTCGDGFKTGDEACDDGNRVDGDGCSAECKVVPVPEPTPTRSGCGCSSAEASGLVLLALAALLRRRSTAARS